LAQSPTWKPEPSFMQNGKFGMAEFLKQALKA
jgi:hypothetical protein